MSSIPKTFTLDFLTGLVARCHRSRSQLILLFLLFLASLCHCIVLFFHLPVFPGGWVWGYRDWPDGPQWIAIILALLSMSAGWYVLHRSGNKTVGIVLLIVLGGLLQHGFARLEGRGIEGLRDRITYSGHADFASVAVRQESIVKTIVDYEELLDDGHLCAYAHSKPPGQLMLYMATQRVSNWFMPRDAVEGKLAALQNFASYVWPFITYLVLFPLFYLTKELSDTETALAACILFVFIPSVNLVTLHTDQVFFPLMSVCSILLVVLALRRQSIVFAAGAGCLLYAAAFCSFGLLALLPLTALFVIGYLLIKSEPAKRFVPGLRIAGGSVAGFIVLDVIFRLVFGYNIVLRYKKALTFHQEWLHWNPSLWKTLHFANINVLEFFFWTGCAVSLLALFCFFRSIRVEDFRRTEPIAGLVWVLVGMLILLALFGKTEGETARLWLFLVPFCCIAAAYEIRMRFTANWRVVTAFVVVLQFVTVYFLKTCQDFH